MVDSASDMTRVQKITLQKLDAYWSEKTQESSGIDRSDLSSGLRSRL